MSEVEAYRTLQGLAEMHLLLRWQSPLEGGHGHTLRAIQQQDPINDVFECFAREVNYRQGSAQGVLKEL